MKIAFEGTVSSHYGQAYVHLRDTFDLAEDVRANQSNGLLGAAQPTALFLTFGLHTGDVKLLVAIADTQPKIDQSWEEIVEASFTMPPNEEVGLADWGGSLWKLIPLEPGEYRVRYCARGFGQGKLLLEDDSPAPPLEQYELTFWKAPLAADRIVKVTRPAAQYWHDVAQGKRK